MENEILGEWEFLLSLGCSANVFVFPDTLFCTVFDFSCIFIQSMRVLCFCIIRILQHVTSQQHMLFVVYFLAMCEYIFIYLPSVYKPCYQQLYFISS